MRLNIDFSGLEQAAQLMGATEPVDLVIDSGHGIKPVAPIDIRLDVDLEFGLSEVTRHSSGLLTYQNRQVVLYIRDHRQNNIVEVLAHGETGNKVHVADCEKLREMRSKGRYNRYVATNNVSGTFRVSGSDDYGQKHEGEAELRVCRYCLGMLNYKGYNTNKYGVFQNFDWTEFFDTYATHFTRRPSRRAGDPETYTDG